jgi:hypothetical protein
MKCFKLSLIVCTLAGFSCSLASGQQYINEMDAQDFQAIGIGQADSERIDGYRNIEGSYSNYDSLYDSGVSEETVSQLREDANLQVGNPMIHYDNEGRFNNDRGFGPAAPGLVDRVFYND